MSNRSRPPNFQKISIFFDRSFLIEKPPIEAAGRLLRFVKDLFFLNLFKMVGILKGQRPGVYQNVLLATLLNHANGAQAV